MLKKNHYWAYFIGFLILLAVSAFADSFDQGTAKSSGFGSPDTLSGYKEYNNFGFSFEYPSSWSIAEESGNHSEGTLFIYAPDAHNKINVWWMMQNDPGSSPYSIIATADIYHILLYKDFETLANTSRIVDGNMACSEEVSYTDGLLPYKEEYTAFNSSNSDRLVSIIYDTPAGVDRDELGFDHLLSTWRDTPQEYQLPKYSEIKKIYPAVSFPISAQHYSRPITGTFMKEGLRGGSGELTIKNDGNDLDAVAALTYPNKAVFSAVYIRSGDSFTITGIQDGIYDLYFTLGREWNSSSGKFSLDRRFFQFDGTLPFETSIEGDYQHAKAYSVTLYTVQNGNAGTDTVAEDA